MARPLLKRLAALAATAALAFTTMSTVAAAPAHADAVCTSSVVLNATTRSYEYGDYMSFRADARTGTCRGEDSYIPSSPTGGATVIDASTDGRTWSRVAMTSSGSSYAYLYGTGILKRSVFLRARYIGGAYAGSTWSSSVSAPVRINVYRKVTARFRSGARATGIFRITPAAGFAGKKVLVQVKKGKWRKAKKLRVNRKGVARGKFSGTRRGTKYRLVVPARGGLGGVKYGFSIRRYY